MTDWWDVVGAPTSFTYNNATGVLTVVETGHKLWTGANVTIWHRNYPSIKKHRNLIATRVDDNTYTVLLPDIPRDIPNGTVPGTCFTRYSHRRSGHSWVNWVQILRSYPLNIVSNGAQSGDTSVDVLARLEADVMAYQPQLVLMQSPTINDQSVSNGPIDEETTYTSMCKIITRILGSGSKLILVSATPVASGEARATVQNMQRVQTLNKRIYDNYKDNAGFYYVDAFRRTVNPTDTTGLATATNFKIADKIHYSVIAASGIGATVAAIVATIAPTESDTRPVSTTNCFANSSITVTLSRTSGIVTATATAHGFRAGEQFAVTGATPADLNNVFVVATAAADTFTFAAAGADGAATGTIKAGRSKNIFNNPVLATATGGSLSGTATGVVAGELGAGAISGTPTAVCSVTAHPSGYGNVQQIDVTAMASGNLIGIQGYGSTTTLLPRMVVGGSYYAEVEVFISSTSWVDTPVTELFFDLRATVDGASLSTRAIEGYEATAVSINADKVLHLRTPILTIPASATTISAATLQMYVRADGAITNSKTLTLKFGRIAVWRQ
jgi:hypothetical protein